MITSGYCQKNLTGKYFDFCDSELTLSPDSTYLYTFQFDNTHSWSSGKWTIINDLIILNNIPIYDTVVLTDTIRQIEISNLYVVEKKEQLVLSQNVIPIKYNSESWSLLSRSIVAGGQNYIKPPKKMLIKGRKLIFLDEKGKPIKNNNCTFQLQKS